VIGSVRATGTLDRSTAVELCRAIAASARTLPPPPLVIDLAGLERCDATGLRALVGAVHEVEVRKGRLVVCVSADGPADRSLARTGLAEFLPVERTGGRRAAAIRAWPRARD
jgi:anti-anti-sigma factor